MLSLRCLFNGGGKDHTWRCWISTYASICMSEGRVGLLFPLWCWSWCYCDCYCNYIYIRGNYLLGKFNSHREIGIWCTRMYKGVQGINLSLQTRHDLARRAKFDYMKYLGKYGTIDTKCTIHSTNITSRSHIMKFCENTDKHTNTHTHKQTDMGITIPRPPPMGGEVKIKGDDSELMVFVPTFR